MENYIKFIIRYRFFVLGLLLLITILSGVVLSGVKITGSLAELMLGDSPKYPRYLERGKAFGSDQLIIIAFEDEDLFSKRSIERLKRAVRLIKELPEIKKVQSILDLQNVGIVGGIPRTERPSGLCRCTMVGGLSAARRNPGLCIVCTSWPMPRGYSFAKERRRPTLHGRSD